MGGEAVLHVHWRQASVGQGAADRTSEGEARVECDSAQLRRRRGLSFLLHRIEVDAARADWGLLCCLAHCTCSVLFRRRCGDGGIVVRRKWMRE